jgi:carbamoyl-phosphate synthase large subunit
MECNGCCKTNTMNANVLVTGVGSIVGQGIIKSLKLSGLSHDPQVKYRIIAADMSAQAAGLYRCDKGILVPPALSPIYVESIIKICKEHNIDAIYIGTDNELLPIANAKERIESETDAIVISNPMDVLAVTRDKWKTFQFLKENNLPTPTSSLPENSEKFVREFGFPVVVKPRDGYGGSVHFYVVNNKTEMEYAISIIHKRGWHPILQEYLKGDDDNTEFTSGVTVDRHGRYVMSSISIRKIAKNGQTYKAFIDDFKDVRRDSEEVALKLEARGAINIQAKLEGNKPKIFEINPRFSATCPIRSTAGINEPDIVFRNLILGEDIKISSYQRLICMRYSSEVYVGYSTYEKASSIGTVEVENNDSFIPNYF